MFNARSSWVPRFAGIRFRTVWVLTIAASLVGSRAACGLDLTVDSTADEPAADPSIATCISTPSGKCTLRAAVMVTNLLPGPHTITVPAGVYTLTRPGYDDTALSGDLDLAQDLTIQGAGSAATIVDGNGPVTGDRVFQVLPSVQTLTLKGMTIRNGQGYDISGGFNGGGGLYIEGSAASVLLSDVIVESNSAPNGGGIFANFSLMGGLISMNQVIVRNNTSSGNAGGISLQMPSSASLAVIAYSQVYGNTANLGGGLVALGDPVAGLTIQSSEFHSNTASYGGAIINYVPATILDSHLHDNHATAGSGGGIMAVAPYAIYKTNLDANSATFDGGAIYERQDKVFANPEFGVIDQSTISGNGAQNGGGIYHDSSGIPGSVLLLRNSTVSANGVFNHGTGGAGLFINGGQVYLLNSTITANSAAYLAGFGGGVYITGGADFKARNSIIANNFHHGGPTTVTSDDGYTVGTVTGELAFDLIGTTANFFISGPQGGNVIGQDPKLGALQDNGGLTKTHALLTGSPAINAGASTGCTSDTAGTVPLKIDQRGAPRPYSMAGCDIGAFEVNPAVTLDIDASSSATKYDALTDGLLAVRYLNNFGGAALTTGALGATATRDAAGIATYLDKSAWALDIDGDGTIDPATDGLLILRYLFGFRGDALIQNATAINAIRNTSALIETYLGTLVP